MAAFLYCLTLYVVSGFVHQHPIRQKQSLLRTTKENKEMKTTDETRNKSKEGDVPSWLNSILRREKSSSSSDVAAKIQEYDNAEEEAETLFDSFPFSIGGRDKRSRIWEDEMSPVVASLSGMINIEALMAAANVTAANMTADVEEDRMKSDSMQDIDSTRTSDAAKQNSLAQLDTNVVSDALNFLDGSMRWERIMQQVQKKNESSRELDAPKNDNVGLMSDLVKPDILQAGKSSDVDKILGEATKRLELAVNSVSSTFSPSAIQGLVLQASKTLALQEASGNLTLAAKIVIDQASKAPRATAKYTAELIEFANTTLAGGMTPLFKNYESVKAVSSLDWRRIIKKGSEYGAISGAIYENSVTNMHSLGHSIVAQGKTSDIAWMITDSIQQSQDFDEEAKDEPVMVRSFIFRGFDASDDGVDRECLLNRICAADPVSLGNSTILVHQGMFEVASSLYEEIEGYISLTAPAHKFVFAGHSIGGSLSVLLLALLSQQKSASFVRERCLRVFTYGSPPIFATTEEKMQDSIETCAILDILKLPQDIVMGYSQPWDPVPRLFTQYDPLYPLVDDLGEDGVTPYVNGPSRTLRPIVKALLEAWEGWPKFREVCRSQLDQNYQGVGKQYLLLPDPTRYLTDRLVSVNIAEPAINSILQISTQEMLPALNEFFLLDTFTISTVPVAIRSFVHHFYPAYLDPLLEYATKTDPDRKTKTQD